ncbi:MAG: GlsB/YeaQ/YmgE family stress response membrane protein [Candidatus Acidiferrales bacterium]
MIRLSMAALATLTVLGSQVDGHRVYVEVTSPGFIATIIIGLLAGWIAGHITRGRGFGCIVDVLLGLIGAVIGRWLFIKLGIAIAPWGFWGTLAAATVGAVLLVAVARLFAGGRD